MGHSPYQHPILKDGGAGHSLHDAAGKFQQFRVGDVQDHIFGGFVLSEGDLLDGGIEETGLFSGNGGKDFDRAGVDFVTLCHGDGLGIGRKLIQPAIHAVIAVGIQLTGRVSGDKGALQLSGSSGGSGLDTDDGGFHDFSLRQRHQLTSIDIADSVSQTGEISGGRVKEGHRPNSGGAVPHPQPQMVVMVEGGKNRGKGQMLQIGAAANCQRERLSAASANQLGQLLFRGDFFSVQTKDDIALPDAGIPGRIDRLAVEICDRSGADNHHAIGHHLNPEGGSAQGNHPAVHDLNTDILDFDEPQEAQIHLEGVSNGGIHRNRVGAAAGSALNHAVIAKGKLTALCQKVAVRQQSRKIERNAESQQNQDRKNSRNGAVGIK